jgi:drug/metabolite transporter (DMT)-like permease
MHENLLLSFHEDHLTIGVLTVFFLFTSGLLNLILGVSTKPFSDHFVQAFFALLTCAAAFGCIALMASTRYFHDDEKAYSSMIIGGTAVTFVFLACSLGLLQFFEDENSLRLVE